MASALFETPTYPGIDVNENQGPMINVVTSLFIAISAVTICLRFFSRWWTEIALWMDDYLIIVAAIPTWVFSVMNIVEVQRDNYGQHIGKLDGPQLIEFNKTYYVGVVLYPVGLAFSKLSLLALYWRIFQTRQGQTPIVITGALNSAWMVAAVFVGIFQCAPVKGIWNFRTKASCISYPAFIISNEGFTITLDIVVLVLPVYFISSIKRSRSQRISISSTFLLGLIVAVVSCVRLARLIHSENIPGFDPTYKNIDAHLWAAIELNLWVLVASIPALRPLIGRFVEEQKEARKKSLSIPVSSSVPTYELSPPQRARLGIWKRDSMLLSDCSDTLPGPGYMVSVSSSTSQGLGN